jgi:hypothetical protein
MPIRAKARKDQPFRAARPEHIEMVLIERSALLMLTSIAKAMVDAYDAQAPAEVHSNASLALKGAINLAEDALNIQEASKR